MSEGYEVTGVAHGELQGELHAGRHGLQQPQLHPSQQQPPAEAASKSPITVENRRFIPGFLSFGIGSS